MRPTASVLRLWPFTFLLAACGSPTPQGDTPLQDTTSMNFEGEFNAQTEGSWFQLCSNGHRYRVGGAALPGLQHQHATVARAGEPVKAWVTGWLGTAVAAPGSPADSVLFVTQVLHVLAGEHCPPIPRPAYAGRYEVSLEGSNGRPRDIIIDLFGDGDALLSIDLHDGGTVLEEDGTWGINSRDQVETIWTSRAQHQHFRFVENQLVSDPGPFAQFTVLLDRTMPEAPRMAGTFGEVGKIFQEHGQLPQDTLHLRTAPLTTLLPDSAHRTAFIQDVIARAPIRSDAALKEMALVGTYGDVVRIVRFERRRRS
ncbi:MAG: hypothetical protein JNM31_13970 [Flavobacteriales bacterium]|nr:hypothetical protein [Flavobacteriales bacterium]